MRLDRYLTLCDLGTRREVKELIASGRVSLAGMTARSPGATVKGPVTLDGEPVAYRPLVAIVMNKPAGLLTATADRRQGTVLDLLAPRDRRREPAPVGRLDKDTTGLLLITDDGQAAHALISPKSGVEKRYRALLDSPVDESDVEAFAQGLQLSDFEALPARLEPGEGCVAYCTVREGKFHQVKRMFAARGRRVLALHRERVGSLWLPDTLAPGQYDYLNMDAWNQLRSEAGLPAWREG
ncbi:MAG: pseudouridine synthase [Christensenellaceae bacterium]